MRSQEGFIGVPHELGFLTSAYKYLSEPITLIKGTHMNINRIASIPLHEVSEITKIAYRTLYERYKAGTIKGYSQGGIVFAYIAGQCEYLNLIINFNKNNETKIKIDFSMEEKKDKEELYKTAFYVNYDNFIFFLDDISKIEVFRDGGSTIVIHFIPDEDKKVIYIPMILTFDDHKIKTTTYDMNNPELVARQKRIDGDVHKILSKYNNHFPFIVSNGSGGILTLNDGHISAKQVYLLCP